MADIGALALRFALVIAVFGLGAGIFAGIRRDPGWTRVAERAAWVVFGAVTLAMVLLFVAADAIVRYIFRMRAEAEHHIEAAAAGWTP